MQITEMYMKSNDNFYIRHGKYNGFEIHDSIQ